jgi:hypothetical protein
MADKVEKKLSAAPFPAVQLVSEWALLTAGFFIVFFALVNKFPPVNTTSLDAGIYRSKTEILR